MDTNIETQVMESMIEIVEKLLNNLKEWDGNMDSGIELIEANQSKYDQLKYLDQKLRKVTISDIDDKEYNEKINLLLTEQDKLSQALRNRQEDILQGMRELSKKSKVMNSYISVKKGTVFIDKDI